MSFFKHFVHNYNKNSGKIRCLLAIFNSVKVSDLVTSIINIPREKKIKDDLDNVEAIKHDQISKS